MSRSFDTYEAMPYGRYVHVQQHRTFQDTVRLRWGRTDARGMTQNVQAVVISSQIQTRGEKKSSLLSKS